MLRSFRALALVFALYAIALVAPTGAQAVNEPFGGTEGATTSGATDAIPQQHIAIAWAEGHGALSLAIDADDVSNTWTIVVFSGGAPANVTAPCSGAGTIVCVAPDEATFQAGLEIWTGDGTDDVNVDPAAAAVPVVAYLRDGGTGQTFRGGPGNDSVNTHEDDNGDGGLNYLLGGRGDDAYFPATSATTLDYVSFDDGRPAESHTLSLDCGDNDGSNVSGENENIGCKAQGMDGLIGSDGNDMVFNNPGGVLISGGDGSDNIDGGDGLDYMYGGNGDDTVSAGNAVDSFWGDRGWPVDDGAAGDGDDTVNAVDTVAQDLIESCGGGNDVAYADDLVIELDPDAALDCETKELPPGPAGSDGYISVFTFGVLPERVIFDPTTPSSANIDVSVSSNGTNTWTIDYTATAPISPRGPECVADNGNAPAGKHRAVCTVTNAQYLAGMEVWLGDGNSTLTPNQNITVPFLVHPEAGTNTVSGASGHDEFRGDDYATVTTINTMSGGLGADRFIGGVGLDYVDYTSHPGPGILATEMVMTMDCIANDGGPQDGSKGDNVGCSTTSKIDGIIGSNSRDVITGDAGDNTIYGRAGNDLIDGGAGVDLLKGQNDHDHLTGGTGSDRVYGDDVLAGSDGSDTLIVNDGEADTNVDCGGAEDAVTYDSGLDTVIACENLTPPATTPTPTTPTPTNPTPTTPTKDTTVPAGWTRGETIPPKTVDFTFPVAAYTKAGVTWEGVLLALAFANPVPPDMKMTAKPLSFNQLPGKWQDDDIAEQQFVAVVIKSGAAPGKANTIRWTEGQALPVVEFQYYDATKGAPINRSCPASGEVPKQGGGTINLFRYVETLPLNDALYWLNRYGCRVDSQPTLVRSKKAAYAGIANVRSAKVGTQRKVFYSKVVPVKEELRIILAPDYTLQSTELTLAVDDQGEAKKSVESPKFSGLTAACNTQRIGVHVIEESTGRLVPGARVELRDEDGKVINSFDPNIARPTKFGAPIAFADKHMRTNDVGYTRLTFKVDKVSWVSVHAWVENPSTGTPIAERVHPIAVYGRTDLRNAAGVRYEKLPGKACLTADKKTADTFHIAKNQGGKQGPDSKGNGRLRTGFAPLDGLLDIMGLLDDNPAVQTGAPGVAKLGAAAEQHLSQSKPAQNLVAELAAKAGGNAAYWDGGGTAPFSIKGKLVAAGGGNLVAAGGGNLVAAGGGNMVAAGGGNLVAAGGGNLVAAGGGNLVAAGGGNLVAAGGGNLVAAGGGNLVAAGGLNKLRRNGVAIDWLETLRVNARSAADNKGTAMFETPTNVIWIDEDTSVLVGPNSVIPEGTLIHYANLGVPVNYPGTR